MAATPENTYSHKSYIFNFGHKRACGQRKNMKEEKSSAEDAQHSLHLEKFKYPFPLIQ